MGVCCSCSRELVSKKKIRTKTDDATQSPKGGVNLDLTLIHPQIVCMGIPAIGVESWYRNPYEDVKTYLEFKFGTKYWVYNLCSEEGHHYGPERFDGRVSNFPFPDHHASPLEFVPKFCAHALAFLSQDPGNVVCIHCKAGKGRTGQFASSLLMRLEPTTLQQPQAAIAHYGKQRTSNGRGLTIPSQIRYVEYYAALLARFGGEVPSDGPDAVPTVEFLSITFKGMLGTLLDFESFSFEMPNGTKVVVPTSAKTIASEPALAGCVTVDTTSVARQVTYHLERVPGFRHIRGDVRLNLNHGGKWRAALTFHTLFLEHYYPVSVIDQLYKSKHVEAGDGIYLDYMEKMGGAEALPAGAAAAAAVPAASAAS